MIVETEITTINSSNQQYTQFKYTDTYVKGYAPPVYLLLRGEMTPEQVELFKHQDIGEEMIRLYTRDRCDIASHHLSASTRAKAIALALCMQAYGALLGDDKGRALTLLEAGEWLSETFTAIGDVPFIVDGTLPYTDSYRMESWMQEMRGT